MQIYDFSVLNFVRLCAGSEWRYVAFSDTAAVPFAGAIATGAMPRIDVGWLGRPSWQVQADSA